MLSPKKNRLFFSIILPIFFSKTCDAIKCFDCNSANNSACLDLHMQEMHAIVPIVDCAKSLPNTLSKHFFCRKITQTILHANQNPEVRVTRSCGWIKHKRECYSNDNKDHLETVCQCFGDMCNATTLEHINVTLLVTFTVIFVIFRS